MNLPKNLFLAKKNRADEFFFSFGKKFILGRVHHDQSLLRCLGLIVTEHLVLLTCQRIPVVETQELTLTTMRSYQVEERRKVEFLLC